MGPAGADGSQGIQGPQGPAGPQGSGLEILGQVDNSADLDSIADPSTGDIYVVSDTDQLAVWDGGEWFFIERLQGEQGPQGETGLQGPKGDQGLRGEPGERGEQGLTGATGDRGPQGIQGLQGEQGEQGPQGIQGPQGAQGPTGSGLQVAGEVTQRTDLDSIQSPVDGDIYVVSGTDEIALWDGSNWVYLDRLQGPVGPAGAQGDAGPPGAQGPKGDTGAKGETGAQEPPVQKGTLGRPALLDQEVSRGHRGQWGCPLEPLQCGWVVHRPLDFYCVVAGALITLNTPNCIHSYRRICPAIRQARSQTIGDTFPGAMAVVV